MQKKLQMRIEGKGKYLQAILDKAQKSLSLDVNNPCNLEATKAQLSEFNLALSSFIENVNAEERNAEIMDKRMLNDMNRKMSEQNYLGLNHGETNDVKLRLEGASINFDLNTRSSYDFIGTSWALLEPNHLIEVKMETAFQFVFILCAYNTLQLD